MGCAVWVCMRVCGYSFIFSRLFFFFTFFQFPSVFISSTDIWPSTCCARTSYIVSFACLLALWLVYTLPLDPSIAISAWLIEFMRVLTAHSCCNPCLCYFLFFPLFSFLSYPYLDPWAHRSWYLSDIYIITSNMFHFNFRVSPWTNTCWWCILNHPNRNQSIDSYISVPDLLLAVKSDFIAHPIQCIRILISKCLSFKW